MSTVSVLIPNFNGKHHLETCLASLQNQTAAPAEILLFDNGSTDGSAEFVSRQFPSVRLIRSNRNLGFAAAINEAAAQARGEWLALLNNDMRASEGWLESALDQASQHACIACRILNWSGDKVDFDGASLQFLGFGDQAGSGRSSSDVPPAAPLLFACGGAMLIRRSVFAECGGLDEDYFAVYEDVDLGWRLWLQGHDVQLAPASVVYHRGHATLDSRREEKKRHLMHRNALFTIVKNYGDEAFRSIVPLALLQCVRRAVRFAGIDKTAFYFWEERELPSDPGALWMLRDAVNHLVALDDVIEAWPSLMSKRTAVQAGRRRSDSEILPLFREPFRRIFPDVDYERGEGDWVAGLDIARLFPGAVPFAMTPEFDREQERQIAALRRELSNLKKAAGIAVPPSPRGGKIRKLAGKLTGRR